jgi:hypothetical protein
VEGRIRLKQQHLTAVKQTEEFQHAEAHRLQTALEAAAASAKRKTRAASANYRRCTDVSLARMST